tara:strand:+ start:4581 stop:5024 length:444 start_codon:yes stop_codon:yes gene_type:complete
LKLPKLNFPEYLFRYKKSESNQPLIFDKVRKKWLVLTPEEWVRQNIISHLIEDLGYPESVFKIETGLLINENKRRSDVLVYKNSKPFVLIECKAHTVDITKETLYQAMNYNTAYDCPYIILTNGKTHSTINVCKQSIQLMNHFPCYI